MRRQTMKEIKKPSDAVTPEGENRHEKYPYIIPASSRVLIDNKKCVEIFLYLNVIGGYDFNIGFLTQEDSYNYLLNLGPILIEITTDIQR